MEVPVSVTNITRENRQPGEEPTGECPRRPSWPSRNWGEGASITSERRDLCRQQAPAETFTFAERMGADAASVQSTTGRNVPRRTARSPHGRREAIPALGWIANALFRRSRRFGRDRDGGYPTFVVGSPIGSPGSRDGRERSPSDDSPSAEWWKRKTSVRQ